MADVVDILSDEFLDSFERRQAGPIDATPTPFPTWNGVSRDDGGGIGLGRGWFVTVGGNPGYGKSLVALNLAKAAIKAGESVGFISLEMEVAQLAARSYAILTESPIRSVEKGESFDADRFGEVRSGIRKVSMGLGIPGFYVVSDAHHVDDVMGMMDELRNELCRYFVIDYMQLVGTGADSEIHDRTTEVATTAARFAKSTGCTVVGLSQFNRRTSADYELPPKPQGLYGGMSLEANSDQIVLLDHSRYERDALNNKLARTWLLVAKNRHGGQGEIPVLWDYRTLTVREAMPDEEKDWP